MLTVSTPTYGPRDGGVTYTLGGLGLAPVRGQEDHVRRVENVVLPASDVALLRGAAQGIGVTDRFVDVIDTFKVPEGRTPAGFRIDCTLAADGQVVVDLVRDISRDVDGVRRPTGVVFSADTANPYEVAPVAPLLGNLTCNPGIVYDLFINNPEANIDHRFNTLEEVMTELGSILGSGCDISVEIEDPFEPDFDKILEAIAPFEEILSPYRLVVKVPHMGPVNRGNVGQLLEGSKKLDRWYAEPSTEDAFRSHNLALQLRERGYRVNYTLMFEPYQSALALQAKPAFINSFIRHRLMQSTRVAASVDAFDRTHDVAELEKLREFLISTDHFPESAGTMDLLQVLDYARNLVAYRRFREPEGADGLDGVRHNLRLLRQSTLADTRLIVCSMEGPLNYPDLANLIVDPEFADVIDRMVITAEPGYLARFASTNQVISYQRRFMAAAATASRP